MAVKQRYPGVVRGSLLSRMNRISIIFMKNTKFVKKIKIFFINFMAGGSGLQGKVPFGLNRTTGKVLWVFRKGSSQILTKKNKEPFLF